MHYRRIDKAERKQCALLCAYLVRNCGTRYEELARMTGISPHTIQTWVYAGRIYQLIGVWTFNSAEHTHYRHVLYGNARRVQQSRRDIQIARLV